MSENEVEVRRDGRDQYLTLLALILLTFFLLMLADFRSLDTVTTDVLFIVVTVTSAGMLVAAFWTSEVSRRLLRLGVIFGLLMIGGAVLTVAIGDTSTTPPLAWVLLLMATPVVVVRRVASHSRVGIDTIIGALCAYLLIALAFSYLFVWVDLLGDPFFGQPEPSTSFPYFSLVTITTLGYGDIAPATEIARTLATTEAVIGQVFLVVFIARLVSIASLGWGSQLTSPLRERTGDDT